MKVTGAVSLAQLSLSFYDSYRAAAKDTLKFLNATSVTGKFASVSGTTGTSQVPPWTVKYLKAGMQLIAS